MEITKKSRLELLLEFNDAPPTTLFSQQTLCAVLDCSKALAERHRWAGTGVPFLKIGRSVRYRKSDILSFVERQQISHSTSETSSSFGAANNVH